ncbi:MAG: hypothetical protein ACR2HG_14055, partial [Pyrinomonadaceae bacterium]
MKKRIKAERRRGLLLTLLILGIAAILVALPTQFRSTAAVNLQQQSNSRTESHVPGFENYDIRSDKKSAETLADFRARAGKSNIAAPGERAAMLAAESDLRRRVPSLKIEYNSDLRVPEVIAPDVKMGRSFLTSAASGKRSEILRSFVKDNNNLLGVTDAQADELKVVADYTNPDGILSFAQLNQEINGIPVFRGEVKAAFTRSGEIVRVINNLAPALEYDGLSDNFGSPEDAVRAAFGNVPREIKA